MFIGPSKLISAAVPHLPWLGPDGKPLTDVSEYASQVDYLNIMYLFDPLWMIIPVELMTGITTSGAHLPLRDLTPRWVCHPIQSKDANTD